jgi:hypothetical protein
MRSMVKLMRLQYAMFALLLMLCVCLEGAQACAQSEVKTVTVIAGGQVRQVALKSHETPPSLQNIRTVAALQSEQLDAAAELLGGPEVLRRSRHGVWKRGNQQESKPNKLKIPPSRLVSD